MLEATNKEQKNAIEELNNKVCYGECNTYLEMNERKAQRNNFNNIIDEHNQVHNEVIQDYIELQEKYVRETNEREHMEFRRNQSRYKK